MSGVFKEVYSVFPHKESGTKLKMQHSLQVFYKIKKLKTQKQR